MEKYKIVLAQVSALEIPDGTKVKMDEFETINNLPNVQMLYPAQINNACGVIRKMMRKIVIEQETIPNAFAINKAKEKLSPVKNDCDFDYEVIECENSFIVNHKGDVVYVKKEDLVENQRVYHSDFYVFECKPYFVYDYPYEEGDNNPTVNYLASFMNGNYSSDKDCLNDLEDGTVLADLLAQIWKPNTVLYFTNEEIKI